MDSGKKVETAKLTVPSCLEVAFLDVKGAYGYSRPGFSVIGSIIVAAISTVVSPLVRPRILGPGSFDQTAFYHIQNEIICGLNGEGLALSNKQLEDNPRTYAEHLLIKTRLGESDPSLGSVGRLTGYVLDRLQRKQQPGEDAKQYVGDWLEATLANYDRSQIRKVLTEAELKKIHEKENAEIDVRLVLANTSLRTSDLPGLRQQLGQLEAARNIVPNWRKGCIDVPREVLEEADVSPDQSVGYVESSLVIGDWREDTKSDAVRALRAVVDKLDHGERSEGDSKAARNMLRRHIERAIDGR